MTRKLMSTRNLREYRFLIDDFVTKDNKNFQKDIEIIKSL